MDRRFWANKRMISWLNTSEEVCPAYSPILINWDYNADDEEEGPWVEGETFLDGGRLALPAAEGCAAATAYANCIYAINGPFDVQPGSYGQCSVDYPLPLLYDPDSFPIPVDEDDPDPSNVEPGTWEDYLEAYPGDIKGPPLLGLFLTGQDSEGNEDEEVWQPASFMPGQAVTLWQVVFWMPNPDGADSDNLALVMPATKPLVSVARTLSLAFGPEDLDPGETVNAVAANPEGFQEITIGQTGLYRIDLAANATIAGSGVAGRLMLIQTPGDGWANVNWNGTPLGAQGTPAEPGEDITLQSINFQTPGLTVSAVVLTVVIDDTAYPVNGTITVDFTDFPVQNMYMGGYYFLLAGDTLSVTLTNESSGESDDDDDDDGGDSDDDADDPVPFGVGGTLTVYKVSDMPVGTIPILIGLSNTGPSDIPQ